jgi:hypothetical protein
VLNAQAVAILIPATQFATAALHLLMYAAAAPAPAVCRLQVQLLRSLFEQALGEEGAKHVDINTIDGFQVRAVHPC